MKHDIVVPPLGESITDAVLVRWLKNEGEPVQEDEILVEVETDKVTLDIHAPQSGILSHIRAQKGDTVLVGDILGQVETETKNMEAEETTQEDTPAEDEEKKQRLSPSARHLVAQHNLDPAQIQTHRSDGRVTKTDVLRALENQKDTQSDEQPEELEDHDAPPIPPQEGEKTVPTEDTIPQEESPIEPAEPAQDLQHTENLKPTEETQLLPQEDFSPPMPTLSPEEERIPLSRLRLRIAERLKDAQNTAAILTTFNEADMSTVMAWRKQYKEAFEQKHGVRLGLMSFFVKATTSALQAMPLINSRIEGTERVTPSGCHIGVAVGTDKGLIVPVLRHAQSLSFADIEKQLAEYAKKAREGHITPDDLSGGTFTISNGGVYGSLLSTPILNPPQSGILGMHTIQKRVIVHPETDEMIVKPMMYLALSYDHRIIDGQEAVQFLRHIKDRIENPEFIALDI